ncbi:MAG: methylenetetrahydrofolate reductase C-terminal domain-containing protein [Planctomycetota bacterium]|nr:methylenetetrahydrofolate reductase C-terminal domain-containing protein [Planctomycetota bacterium]
MKQAGPSTVWDRLMLAAEWPFKRYFFNCQKCGQCLLSQTAMVCPMNCPKGLRNGPCGGTIEGRCEVYTDRPCVWVRIHDKSAGGADDPCQVRAPFDEHLLNTSSYWNLLTGADQATRKPRALAQELRTFRASPQRTGSRFERRLRGGQPILTGELRCPRSARGMRRVREEIEALLPLVDALTTTSNQGGVPTRSTLDVSREVHKQGGCAIPTLCGRDMNPAAFVRNLVEIRDAGLQDVFCVTGDWPAHEPRQPVSVPETQRRAFRMDGAQMIHEARSLGTLGRAAFSPLPAGAAAPSLFVGGAINPNSAPREAVIRRLAQKAACGVDYIFTQAVCDVGVFTDFLRGFETSGLRPRLFVVASVPVVGSLRGAEILNALPGVRLPAAVLERFAQASDIAAEGSTWTLEVLDALAGSVDGFHLMNFGMALPRMCEVLERARGKLTRTPSARQVA